MVATRRNSRLVPKDTTFDTSDENYVLAFRSNPQQ